VSAVFMNVSVNYDVTSDLMST